MKTIILLLLAISYSASASLGCLDYLSNTDRLNVIEQRKCTLQSSSTGVESVDVCVSKLEDMYSGIPSYAIVGEVFTPKKKRALIVSTQQYTTFEDSVMISQITASPELLTRYKYVAVLDKSTNELNVDFYSGLFSLKKRYSFVANCVEF